MDINIFNNGQQQPQPADSIRIEDLIVTPYPDRFRIHIQVTVTPFQERPNLVLVARDADNNIIGELDVIATMHAQMEFTMHLRGMDDPAGDYTMTTELFYETRNPPQDTRTVSFEIPAADEDTG